MHPMNPNHQIKPHQQQQRQQQQQLSIKFDSFNNKIVNSQSLLVFLFVLD